MDLFKPVLNYFIINSKIYQSNLTSDDLQAYKGKLALISGGLKAIQFEVYQNRLLIHFVETNKRYRLDFDTNNTRIQFGEYTGGSLIEGTITTVSGTHS